MKRTIQFNYINPQLNLGMVDIKQVYSLSPEPELLTVEAYRGQLVYRARGSSRRISYRQLTRGLLKKRFSVEQELPDSWQAPENKHYTAKGIK